MPIWIELILAAVGVTTPIVLGGLASMIFYRWVTRDLL